ncbi:prolyl oligopeptidase family serine peptidase [Kitasatospora sp. NPDC088351]|uniref:alpha/beta hydrolase family protein n=1 Tax=unclassified Kitasatospora TaxID=2633591 RepID=UPI00343DF8D0
MPRPPKRTRERPPGRTARAGLLRAALLAALSVLLLAPSAAFGQPPASAGTGNATADVAATDVRFTGADGVTLHGTVLAPGGTGGAPGPALVMVPGAGPGGREELRPAAEAYARHGIVTLVYDKRTDGYSMTHRDYSQLADDALAALAALRERPGVDRSRTGVWGLSEGAWVVSLAAGRSSDVAFVVTAGAVGLSPLRQQAWAYGGYLRHHGVHGSLLPAMQRTAARVVAGAGLFPEADYDPVPAWTGVRQPVLAEWGTLDREAAPQESAAIIRDALDRGGNTHYTLRAVPGVRHNLNRTADDGFDRPSDLPPDYADAESAWIHHLADGPPAISVDAMPPQEYRSTALTPLAGYEGPWLQLAAVLVCGVGFAGYPLTALVRRLRPGGRADAPRTPSARPARWLAGAGLTALAGGPLYLLFMVVTAGALPGPVLLGRPLPWLLLQLAAVTAVVAATALAVRFAATLAVRRRRIRGAGGGPAAGASVPARAERVRLGLLAVAAVVFVPWALYWGLLIP